MELVKKFRFAELPNNALFYLAMEVMGREALEVSLFEYQVGHFTHPQYQHGAAGVVGTEEYNRYLAINNYLMGEGCVVNEIVYFKW